MMQDPRVNFEAYSGTTYAQKDHRAVLRLFPKEWFGAQ